MNSMFGNTYMCESTYIFYDEVSQIYSKNRNWMAYKTLDDSFWLAVINIGIAKVTIVSKKLDYRHPTDRDLL